MMRYVFLFIGVMLSAYTTSAQIDTLQVLPEVILSDLKLQDHRVGLALVKIKDSTLRRSRTSLTEVLRENTGIYFRENGPGGVSSASFRGTNAAQTAVVWNGININSQLTGQTDFNTISTRNYDNLDVRAGGGSIIYGSGAIGGSVHLNNDIRFGNRFENEITLGYASFDTQIAQAKTSYATDIFYIDLGGDYQTSENDFAYLGTDQFNENGQFENFNFNLNTAFLLSSSGKRKQLLKIHHNTYVGDRNFSGTLVAPSDDAYEDRNTRTLAIWERLGECYNSTVRLAHVFEQFRFFPNKDRDENAIGKVARYIANYEGTFIFDPRKRLTFLGEVNAISTAGSSIQSRTRTIASAVALWKHRLSKKLTYEVQARQEVVAEYNTPFLLGVGAEYAFAKAYQLSFNASRNYRIPTFNDLFWQGAGAVGNPDILPETSIQAEIGQAVALGDVLVDVRTFYINTNDLILWRPNASGIWSPINIAESEHYGAEVGFKYSKKIGEHHLQTRSAYTYTNARNTASGKQLIYVPAHKGVLGLSHQYKWLSSFMQGVFTDRVFTTTDNMTQVDGSIVANAGLTTTLFEAQENAFKITARINNVFNANYQTGAFRPNPGRNFLIQTSYTF